MTGGRRPLLGWPAAIAGLMLTASAVIGVAPAGQAAATAAPGDGCQAWVGAPSNQVNGALFGMTVLAPCDAWLVGDQIEQVGGHQITGTATEHWNGAAWTAVPSPSPGDVQDVLHSVSGVSSNDVWAVGTADFSDNTTQDLIEHWDGTAWTRVPSPDPGSQFNGLFSVHAVSASDVWAVGAFASGSSDQTMILHWDGTAWTQAGGILPGELTSVTGTATNDAWALGFTGTRSLATEIEHWNGTAWTRVPSPTPGGDAVLNGVTATAGSDAWAVGDFSGQQGLDRKSHV